MKSDRESIRHDDVVIAVMAAASAPNSSEE
jgi:hypothetical protein